MSTADTGRRKIALSTDGVFLGVAVLILIVISFAGSYTHIVDLAQLHGQHGIEARATAAVVDILCYVFAAERQRDKRIGRKPKYGITTFPTVGLALGVLELVEASGALLSPDTFFFAPLLKSVSYQPPPFKRKPAAEIFFFNSASLQAGQITKGSAFSFCKASCWWPQALHWYS